MNYKVKFIVRLLFHFPPKFWVKVVDTTQKITKPTEIHFVYLAITNLQLIATKSVLLNLHISVQILVKDIKQNKRTIKRCFEFIVTEEHEPYKEVVSPTLAMSI